MTVRLGLIIDTTLRGVGAAVCRFDHPEAALVTSVVRAENAGSIQAIAGLVQDVTAKAGLKLRELNGVVVGHGPGSFTGIKVGLAFVYGLQAAFPQMLVLGGCALDAAAEESARRLVQGSVAIYLPATRTHGFIAVRRGDGAAVLSARLVDASDATKLAAVLADVPADASHLVMEGWPTLENNLQAEGIRPGRIPAEETLSRALSGLARSAARHWPSGFSLQPPGPRYLRLSTPEERLQAAL